MLKRHEGFRQKPYKDTVGILTIGYGHNLEEGIPEYIAVLILDHDIKIATKDIKKVFQIFHSFSEPRKDALTNMMFNLGLIRFKGFKKMIKAINDNDWGKAKIEALDSKWHKQVGSRAEEIADMMEDG